jgi:hypothetical protein
MEPYYRSAYITKVTRNWRDLNEYPQILPCVMPAEAGIHANRSSGDNPGLMKYHMTTHMINGTGTSAIFSLGNFRDRVNTAANRFT